jgi:transcriptional regulator with XRE-family HTH domain
MPRESEQVAALRARLGRRFARHRARAGLSQRELAERLYYARTSISKIETGQQSAPRTFWREADRILRAGGELVAAFDALAAAKAAGNDTDEERRNGRADQLAGMLATAMVPVARASDRMRSTSATPEEIETVIGLRGLTRAVADHCRCVLMGEGVDWAEMGERLNAAGKACERHVVVEQCVRD